MSDNHHHYVTPLPILFGTFIALCALTVITVWQATQTYIDFGSFEVGLTLLIATVKAALVALLFMQLAHDKPINSIILVSSLLFVALFLSFALMDRGEYKLDVDNFVIQHNKTFDDP